MYIAAQEGTLPKLGRVVSLPSERSLHSLVEVQWLVQEKAPHKPRWMRYFKETDKIGSLPLSDVVLYDFELTKNGALKKKSREYLQSLCS